MKFATDRCSKNKTCFHRVNLFTFATVVSVFLGIFSGLGLKYHATLSSLEKVYIRLPGQLLFWLLQFVTVPLLMTNVILGLAGTTLSPSVTIARRAITYIVITTILSMLIGVFLVTLLKPGVKDHARAKVDDDDEVYTFFDALSDLISGLNVLSLPLMMFILLVCFEETLYRAVYLFSTKQYKTRKVCVNVEPDDFNSTLEEDIEVHLVGKNIDGVNMPGLIAVLFFIEKTVRKIGNVRKPFLEIITTVNGLSKDMVTMIMTYFPIAVVFMMTSYVYDTADRWQTAICLGKFVAVIFAGLVIHGVLVLPLICLLIVRRNPCLVIQGVTPALLRAMLFSRSYAASETNKCCKNALQVNKRITDFMLPITIHANMDGAVLSEMAATIFIAQLSDISLHWSKLFSVGVTVVVATMGEAGIPATGMMTTLFILAISGIPVNPASILLTIKWLLDRLSAVVNIISDCFGVVIVAHLSEGELKTMEEHMPKTGTTTREDATKGRFISRSPLMSSMSQSDYLLP